VLTRQKGACYKGAINPAGLIEPEEIKMELSIDRLGELLAQIATLESEANKIKAALKKSGPGAYEGDLFRATVSVSEREVLSVEACAEKLKELKVSKQWFVAHTKKSSVSAVRVVSRIAEAA
jgi:uncharacterized small protein (DUF1192 family)